MEKNPWLSGCYELLDHGIGHFLKNTEFDRRLAMISIDNALELAIKAYISRNLRVFNIKRKDFNNIKRDFSKLLNLISKVASDKITEQELSSIEHNHELRNNLYHEGVGISVNKKIVKLYGEESISLISKLYEIDLSNLMDKLKIFKYAKKIKELDKLWRAIEVSMLIFILDGYIDSDLTTKERFSELASKGIISITQKETLFEILNFIKKIEDKTKKLTFKELEKIDILINKAKEIYFHLKSKTAKKKKKSL